MPEDTTCVSVRVTMRTAADWKERAHQDKRPLSNWVALMVERQIEAQRANASPQKEPTQ